VYRLILKDSRTPPAGKFFLFLAVGYALMPFDLIPDFIPVLGQLDDIVMIPLLVYIALRCIPKSLVDEIRCAVRKEEERLQK
jgi:uncharacterized membrane protein YkvA (DUF1232 family)